MTFDLLSWFNFYYEVKQETPLLKTVGTSAVSIIPETSEFWVLSYLVRVRSLGTGGTYVAIGDSLAQNFRLISVGETYGFYGNPHEVFNLASVYVKSDVADAVIEITFLTKSGVR